jgi:hypothetical protein
MNGGRLPSEADNMNGDPASRWRAIVACLEHRDGASDEPVEMLEQLQAQLREELYDAAGVPLQRHPDIDGADPRLQILLDALAALALLAPDDPSYPWERGLLLTAADRPLEATEDYLAAAERFAGMTTTDAAVTGDEDDWAQTALVKAAQNLAIGGQPAAAATLLPRLVAALLVSVHQPRHGERHVEHVLDVVVFGVAGPVREIAAVVGAS